MIPDIKLPGRIRHDLYAALAVHGITPGTPLVIYNKGRHAVYLWEGEDPGGLGRTEGVPVGRDPCKVSQDPEIGCSIISDSPIILCVQVAS